MTPAGASSDMVHEDLKPSQIMTREAFENAIVVNSAIGGSTNAPIHLNAIAAHLGVPLDNDDWERIGHTIPLLVDLQPAGGFLGEDYHRAGGVPAVVAELMKRRPAAASGRADGQRQDHGRELQGRHRRDREVIRPFSKPLMADAGFLNLKGNLFDSAIMKTSVHLAGIPRPLPLEPERPGRLRGQRRRVRRARGLSRPHQRSGDGHRRAHASCSCAAPARSATRAARRS